MVSPKQPQDLTLEQRVAAIEDTIRSQGSELAHLRGHMNGRFDEQREWIRETITEAVRQNADPGNFERIIKLRREVMEGADQIYKFLGHLQKQAGTLCESLSKIEDSLSIVAGEVVSLDEFKSDFDEGWPFVESSLKRADKAVEDIQRMLGSPQGPEPRMPLTLLVNNLEHQVGSGLARLSALERQFSEILLRFASGKAVLPPAGETPVIAAPAGSPDSAFPADGLVKVSMGEIGGKPCPVVDARTMHGFLEVRRDFSNWIKKRLSDGGFIPDQDYIALENLSSPNLASSKSRAQVMVDYHLTLETAKHIGMMERNDKGQEVRRYFIDCEERLRAIQARHSVSDVPVPVLDREASAPQDTCGQEPESAEGLPAHYYTAADPLFMACIMLTEKTIVWESEGEEWNTTVTYRPSNDVLMRFAKTLAYLLRAAPRGKSLRYTQYELAAEAGLRPMNFREALDHLKKLEFVAIKRLSKGKPGPTFELSMLWENIEAAARRDGVDLTALGVSPAESKAIAG